MSYRIYAGVQTDVDTWSTKACIYDPGDYSETMRLLSPTLTREVGKAGSLEFTVPLGNVAHSALQKLRTTVEVEQDGKPIWQGRVMSHEQDFNLRQKVYCEGEMAYLNDSGTAPFKASNVSFSQLLQWVCENHNRQVDAYKAFTPGKVQMDEPMVVPYLYDCYFVRTNGHYNYDDDDDRVYNWDLVDKNGDLLVAGVKTHYKERNEPIPEMSLPLNKETFYNGITENGFFLVRTGNNKFIAKLPVAYAGGKTWNASAKIDEAKVSCATCNKSFGTYSIYNITTESKKFKITETKGVYSMAVNGNADDRFRFETKEPTHAFGDGKNYGSTLDILKEILIDKYDGYLVVRHGTDADGKKCRYLDYLQEITDKNPQTIAFGTNLLDLDSYTKAEDIATRVIAVGSYETTGWLWVTESHTITATANDLKAQELYGIITKVIFVDGSSTYQSLQDRADEELAKNLRYLNGMTVKAVDLKDAGIDIDRIELGKQTHIFSAPHGVDTWLLCDKITEPLDAPDKKQFTFGIEFSSLSDLQALSARKASDAYDMSRSIKGYLSK